MRINVISNTYDSYEYKYIDYLFKFIYNNKIIIISLL